MYQVQNSVELEGIITFIEPIRYNRQKTPLFTCGLMTFCVNKQGKQCQRVFHTLQFWGDHAKTAESFRKGQTIAITGSVTYFKYRGQDIRKIRVNSIDEVQGTMANRISLKGKLSFINEITKASSDRDTAKLGLTTWTTGTKGPNFTFHALRFWDQAAHDAVQLTKGANLHILGRIHSFKFDNRTYHEIVVEKIEVLPMQQKTDPRQMTLPGIAA